MLTPTKNKTEATSLSQQVVQTLSRIGISSGRVREIVSLIREVNSKGKFKEDIPSELHYIMDELAKDGVINKELFQGKPLYLRNTQS